MKNIDNYYKFIDDQLISSYLYHNNIPIICSGVIAYTDIYRKLQNDHEITYVNNALSKDRNYRINAIKELLKKYNVQESL